AAIAVEEEQRRARLLRRVAGRDVGDELLVLAVDLDDALLLSLLPAREGARRAVVRPERRRAVGEFHGGRERDEEASPGERDAHGRDARGRRGVGQSARSFRPRETGKSPAEQRVPWLGSGPV